MPGLIYHVWLAGDIITKTSDKQQAIESAQSYIENNPDEAELLHFTCYTRGTAKRPATPVFSVSGPELVDYLNDVAGEIDDEWTDEDD